MAEVEINNTQLFYSVKGEGEPLVLTHGGPFSDHRIWDYQIESVMDHYNVLYPQGTVNSMADDPGRQW
ncbi:alpha/beta fold hydrolase [Desulfosporosinus fructosivorans]